jgi:hypothetical protein
VTGLIGSGSLTTVRETPSDGVKDPKDTENASRYGECPREAGTKRLGGFSGREKQHPQNLDEVSDEGSAGNIDVRRT